MPSPASLANLRPQAPWRKGESGNARGRLATYRTVLRLARTNSPDAMRTLIECFKDPDAPWPARVAAANGLLDRAWGKAPQNLTIDGDAAALLRITFVDMGDAATATVSVERQAPYTQRTAGNGEDRSNGEDQDDDALRLSFESDP